MKNAKKKIHLKNEWIIMDFPNKDVIRRIYQSNNYDILEFYNDNITKKDTSDKKKYNNLSSTQLSNHYKIVKSNYKCVKSPKNQWYFTKNGNYYNIVSVYDNKCLSYNNNILGINECNKNNKNNDFIINNESICSRTDKNYCLDGTHNIIPVPLQSKKYKNLTCSTKFAKLGNQMLF
ncbi:hypothetical protein U3516DRAFT_812978 [Neocallimastix sp. 'constans']